MSKKNVNVLISYVWGVLIHYLLKEITVQVCPPIRVLYRNRHAFKAQPP